jgi:4-amino-4-deoxy-L-arabinose transferase-like glycosyltransferase
MNKRMKKKIATLFVFAVVIRLPFFVMVIVNPDVPYTSHDSFRYDYIGRNLLSNNSYSMYLERPEIKDPVRTPGYPLFLSAVYAVFPDKAIFVALIQLFIDCGIVLLIFGMGRVLFSEKVGMVAGFLYGLNFHQALFTTQILSEILFTLFLTSFILLFIIFLKQGKSYSLLWSGILLSVSILIRPIALFLPIVPFFFLVKKKVPFRLMIIFLAIVILFPVCWSIRNSVVFDQFFLTKVHSVNMIAYGAANIIGHTRNLSRKESEDVFMTNVKQKYALTDYEIGHYDDNPLICDEIAGEAQKIIFSHPFIYLKNQILGVIHTILPINIGFTADVIKGKGTGGSNLKPVYTLFFRYIFRGKILKAMGTFIDERVKSIGFGIWLLLGFMIIYQTILYILAIIGIKKQLLTSVLILFIVIIAYFIIIPGEVGEARFRVPVEPIIAILAALPFLNKSIMGS